MKKTPGGITLNEKRGPPISNGSFLYWKQWHVLVFMGIKSKEIYSKFQSMLFLMSLFHLENYWLGEGTLLILIDPLGKLSQVPFSIFCL